MKNLILHLSIPKDTEDDITKSNQFSYIKGLYDLSIEKAKEYANIVGADYYQIAKPEFEYHEPLAICYQKLLIFDDKFKDYDNIVYVDGDYIFVTETCPNIFEVMETNQHEFFAVSEIAKPYDEFPSIAINRYTKLGLSKDYRYFNSGFFGMKRSGIEKAKPFLSKSLEQFGQWNECGKDQNVLNHLVYNVFKKYCELSVHWNGIFAVKRPLFSIHYAMMRKRRFSIEDHEKLVQEKLNRISNLNINQLIFDERNNPV